MLSALIVIAGIGFLIGVHEAAHMLTAKAFGVRILKFAFGFGPILFSRKVKDTSYELRLLPLGGFVQFAGEKSTDRNKGEFFSLSWWKRTLIALAGPLMNLLVGFLLIFSLLIGVKGVSTATGVKEAYALSSLVTTKTLEGVAGFFTSKTNVSDMAGPILVTKIMIASLKAGIVQFIFILSIISLSLGLFNLFPIPGLDGGHVLLYVVEGVVGKRFSNSVYIIWSYIGFVLLLGLMGLVVFMDLHKLLR